MSLWRSLQCYCLRCLNVLLDLALPELVTNFSPLSDTADLVDEFAMILGASEYFTVLVLFFPVFLTSLSLLIRNIKQRTVINYDQQALRCLY